MNERIEKLWTKVCQCEMPELDETCMTSQRRTKFAELIVRKCMSFQDEAGVYSKFDMADAIAKHFGVEE